MSCCALLAVIHFSLCLLTFFLSLVAAVDCIADSSKCSDICASEQMGAHGCQAECETDRQTDAATDTDRPTHTCTHTLSLTHTHTHTRTHTHTLSHSPPPHVTPSLRLFLCPILYLSDPQHCHLVCDQRQGAVVPARRPAPPHVHHLQGHEPRACVWAHGLFFPAGLPGPLRRL